MKATARRRVLRLLSFALAASLSGPPPVSAVEALNSSRYFADPAVAAFVDDVQRGDVSRVKQGLAAGISANAQGSDGFRPIHFVFVAPRADVLRELLAAGADPNAKLSNGNPPLEFAVRMPNPDFTAALLGQRLIPMPAAKTILRSFTRRLPTRRSRTSRSSCAPGRALTSNGETTPR